MKLAIKEKAAGLASDSFDALQYAIGFGAHVTGDTAGFYPNAYLGNALHVFLQMLCCDAIKRISTSRSSSSSLPSL